MAAVFAVRRFAGLLDEALEWPALLAAARRARRGKRNVPDVMRFHAEEADRLIELRDQLRNGNWTPGTARVFHITEPKPRWISAAPYADRVVHQIVCAPLEKILERRLRPECMANRRGRGVDAALRLARREMQRHSHVLCLDVRAYFGSIDHQILHQQLTKMIKDSRYLKILERIVAVPAPLGPPHWFPGDDLLTPIRPRGIAIGNLTSQHFGNLFLNLLDQRLSNLPVRWVRYVDDVLVFGSPHLLASVVTICRQTLADLRLTVHPHKTRIQPIGEPLRFLGLIMNSDGQVRPPSRSRSRWRKLDARGLLMRSRSGIDTRPSLSGP
jgi:RNA-directed DNA polymerase